MLKAYGSELVERFQFGVLEKFHEGGEYFDPSAEIKRTMEHTPLTTDSIESFFGIVDNVTGTNNKNLSFHFASGMGTWCGNGTVSGLVSDTLS